MTEVTWPALESNPDTINPFLDKMGIKGVECIDVYSFDEEMLSFLPPKQLAMLLCFPDAKKVRELMAPVYAEMKEKGHAEEKVFFMVQKIHNACGTFALFHSLANLESKIDLGSGSFKSWLDKAKPLSSSERSDLLAKDPVLAAAHAEAAHSGDNAEPEHVEHHFIAYVNVDGTLYEIDSSAPFPRPLGASSDETLVKDAGKACKELMEKLNNVSFAAMALVPKN